MAASPAVAPQTNYTVELQYVSIGPAGGKGVTAMAPPPADRDDGDARANPDGRIPRDVVLAAALELIDRDGVDGLSMRRLARVLGRDPMILYRHAPNKAALLDGVAEMVLAQLKVDWPILTGPGSCVPWPAATARWRWPPERGALLVTRPLAAPLGLRPRHPAPLEDILTLLTRAGFSGPDALHIYRALFGSCTATSSTSCSNSSRTQTDRRPAAAGPVPAADPRIPPAAQPGPRPGLLRRRHRTRARPGHPPHRPNRLADPRPAAQPGPGPRPMIVSAAARATSPG